MSFLFSDLFAGVGGMRFAFEKEEGQCVLTSENDEHALKTYKANFGKQDELSLKTNTPHILHKDILNYVVIQQILGNNNFFLELCF